MERKKIFLVSLAHLSCDINGGALPAALPYVRAAYNLDYQATGGLMLAYSCLSSILQPFLGFLADKHNKPWFIPLGVLLAGTGISLMSFLSNYWAIFLGIAISGVGSGFFHPEGARYANRVSGSSKGKGMSLFSIGGNSGFILGPLAVTIFVGTFGLIGMSFFGALAITMAVILFFSIRKLPKTLMNKQIKSNLIKQVEFSAEDPEAAEGDELAQAKKFKPAPENNWHEFTKLIFVIITRSIIFAGCNTFIPLYWVSVFNQSKGAGAMALVLFGCFGVACNLLGGFLTDKFGTVKVIRLAYSLMPLVLLLFALTSNVYWAWAVLPLLGLAIYLPFSSQVVLGQTLLAKNIGFASGVTLGIATTLGGIAQPCLGWVADNFGLHSIFICLCCVGLVGATMTYTLNKKYGKSTL